MHKYLLLLGLFASTFSFGQIEEVRRITEQLCAPEFHGRGYVNKGDSIAADYLVSEFEKLGIGGYKGTSLQRFNIEFVNTFPGKMHVEHKGRVLTPGIHYVVDPFSAGGKLDLKPIDLTADILLDRDRFTAVMGDVLSGSDYNAAAIHLEGLSQDTLNQLMGVSQSIADYLPVIEITDKKMIWAVGTAQFPHPIVKIQDSIYRGGPISIDIENELIRNYESQNVIAHLPGKRRLFKKTIVFTAHYDHLGRMGKDVLFPGANDNASGTAMLLTMANYFKEHRSKYDVVFIAFGGEEAGLLGSQHYVENPLFKLKKIKFLVNLDIMGSGEEGITAVNGKLFEDEFQLLLDINEEKQLLSKIKKRGAAANSDHYWFTEQGVPAFFIYTMGPNKNYHDIFDTYDNLSFKEYEDITTLLIEFLKRI